MTRPDAVARTADHPKIAEVDAAASRSASVEWDARTYDRIADPMHRWGLAVLDRLPLRGDERVLDAGCGSGRVTEALVERLPDGEVVALDASGAMLDEAQRRLARFGDRVSFVRADLSLPLPLDRPVDAILSTATLHWVRDQEALYRNLAGAIRPGGRLVAQCGGAGNIQGLLDIVRGLGGPDPGVVTFASPEETLRRLAEAGFVDARAWLTAEPTPIDAGAPLETFLATVCLKDHIALLPPDRRATFAAEVARRMPEPVLDYVRLNIEAVRGDASPG